MTTNGNDDCPHPGASDSGKSVDAPTRIRELNDRFRHSLLGGKVVMTRRVADLDPARISTLLDCVRRFDAFTPDNDPHGEHDFGAFDDGGERFFWKIDYYDKEMQFASPDAADADVTMRVLTLMFAEDY
jgi:hypothetical protein